VRTKNFYAIKKEQGMSHDEIMRIIWSTSRDNSRTPMQWDRSINAGFTSGKPWIKVNPNYTKINAADEEKDPNSVLNFYKKMILLRKQNIIFIYGTYDLILEDHEQIFAYTRTLDDEKVIIICNLTDSEALYEYKDLKLKFKNLLLNNYPVEAHEETTSINLKPYEVRVYRV
jgi:alpha-glucosidase